MKPQRYWAKVGGVVFMSTEGEGATVLYSKDIANSNLASETHLSL